MDNWISTQSGNESIHLDFSDTKQRTLKYPLLDSLSTSVLFSWMAILLILVCSTIFSVVIFSTDRNIESRAHWITIEKDGCTSTRDQSCGVLVQMRWITFMILLASTFMQRFGSDQIFLNEVYPYRTNITNNKLILENTEERTKESWGKVVWLPWEYNA